jgi:hypothetical protein
VWVRASPLRTAVLGLMAVWFAVGAVYVYVLGHPIPADPPDTSQQVEQSDTPDRALPDDRGWSA